MIDLIIIGAGAAGMSAAIEAKRNNQKLNVLILEKKAEPGKKIIASGNGKCNLSNESCENVESTLDFFKTLGVITRSDSEGRVYPFTEESKVVVEGLTSQLDKLGVTIKCNQSVSSVEKKDNFIVNTEKGDTFISKNLLISCGGKSSPKFGTTGDGYKWAKTLGHSVTRLVPVLTAIDVKENIKDFSGIRAKGTVTLIFDGKKVFSEAGEIQFTKDGISGICVFNMSRFLLIPEGKTIKNGFDDYEIEIDFYPGDDLDGLLAYRKSIGFSSKEILRSIVRVPIADWINEECHGRVSDMPKALHHFKLHPNGAKGWDFAQVTRGGVALAEIDCDTMESKLCSGLYFAGEVIDYDGPCGGYNLQNAWESGIKAGRKIGNV